MQVENVNYNLSTGLHFTSLSSPHICILNMASGVARADTLQRRFRDKEKSLAPFDTEEWEKVEEEEWKDAVDQLSELTLVGLCGFFSASARSGAKATQRSQSTGTDMND